jgi:hypothetical protein
MPSTFVLVVVLLTVESSYLRNTERPVDGVSDTVQFCFTHDRDWRIKTYAMDHDIHVHVIREPGQERVFGQPTPRLIPRSTTVTLSTASWFWNSLNLPIPSQPLECSRATTYLDGWKLVPLALRSITRMAAGIIRSRCHSDTANA